jgi:DNA polymerase-3 subunit alpha
MDWQQLKDHSLKMLDKRDLPKEYRKRLKKELREIEKQGANNYWIENFENEETWAENKHGLVLPWLLGMTEVDPVKNNIAHVIEYQQDFPDIDLDFLPIARQTIKEFAAKKYVNVCSVGNWNTYKPKSALQDATRALGGDFRDALIITKQLPKEFDDLTLEDHAKFFEDSKSDDPKVRQEAYQEIARYQPFYDFKDANPQIVDFAYRMVGKIKSQGTHAGGLIIADRPVDMLIPLAKIGEHWTSQWTEGDKPQLSKFGLIKFDILGLNTVLYIWKAAVLIHKTRGIMMSPIDPEYPPMYINWSEMDPTADPPRIGYEYMPDGTKKVILLNDPEAIKMCNELRTESVFQVESDIQKGIISDGGVKTFWDLVVYNALGRPGPIDMIPEYIIRRDDGAEKWRDGVDERITKILEGTYNVIVYQEQLTAIWQAIAGFTVPEAEASRKIIAKKWQDKLPKVEEQWKNGAAKSIGQEQANEWWDKMVTFGRYAFNLAHSVAYSLITYMCLYLKAHYPSEWWAAVMTHCHPDKLAMYMSAARLEGVQFGSIHANSMQHEFSVRNGMVVPGLKSIKGIGEVVSRSFTEQEGPFESIDKMVEIFGKKKVVFERLIKLGAFDEIHPNRRGLWMWYQYKYCSGKEVTALKKAIHSKLWPEDKVLAERKRQEEHHRRMYPKRKVPKKILNWKPKPDPSRDEVMMLYKDYDEAEKVQIEKELLGYYWGSPLKQYENSGITIEDSKIGGIIEGVVESIEHKRSRKGNRYYVLRVTDGIQTVPIVIWADVYDASDKRCFSEGVGIRINVMFNEERNSFRIADDTSIIPLLRVGEGGIGDTQLVPVIDEETYPLF